MLHCGRMRLRGNGACHSEDRVYLGGKRAAMNSQLYWEARMRDCHKTFDRPVRASDPRPIEIAFSYFFYVVSRRVPLDRGHRVSGSAYGGRKFVTNGALSPPQRKLFLGSSRKAHSSSADTESRVSRRKESGHELSALEEAALSLPPNLTKNEPEVLRKLRNRPLPLGRLPIS